MKGVKKLGFYSAFILPVLLIMGFYLGGAGLSLIHIFVFILVPLMDYFIQKDQENVPSNAIAQKTKERFYKLVTFAWVYVQVGVLVWGFYVVVNYSLSFSEWIWLSTGMALVTGGVGITVAHELGHKTGKLEQFYAKVLLMTVCYMHFIIEHNRGHHVRVATPDDPATSRKGETFYAFWWRSVKDGYLSAIGLEKARLNRKQKPAWSLDNQMILFAILPLLFVGVFTIGFSLVHSKIIWEIPIFFIVQSFFGFSLLELVNYIEHYGMERKRLPNGRYEKVTPLHSWNASHTVSNFLLFQLQRHSDHHAFAYKPYQVLEHREESPQLPQGYSAMIILALFPPLWFMVMDRKLDKWKTDALSSIN
ncbi:Alkane-1 monooxygenase [Indibacter alkaliphilus LW1]|uniref:Alkane-1 monooxygenase n=1 Tax=Indibacter alkaliphilus (strain CCUG 57479 / KCTC 22604 / LW1) TaxID=1189612 RepID=S2E188_INDAL|nr:alkane 1-monooxygenase [Indibacter alkaliphilus]EOZ95853.1 Alkane-1 monooxygenase [Indibacter alkaliphilus LW1]